MDTEYRQYRELVRGSTNYESKNPVRKKAIEGLLGLGGPPFFLWIAHMGGTLPEQLNTPLWIGVSSAFGLVLVILFEFITSRRAQWKTAYRLYMDKGPSPALDAVERDRESKRQLIATWREMLQRVGRWCDDNPTASQVEIVRKLEAESGYWSLAQYVKPFIPIHPALKGLALSRFPYPLDSYNKWVSILEWDWGLLHETKEY